MPAGAAGRPPFIEHLRGACVTGGTAKAPSGRRTCWELSPSPSPGEPGSRRRRRRRIWARLGVLCVWGGGRGGSGREGPGKVAATSNAKARTWLLSCGGVTAVGSPPRGHRRGVTAVGSPSQGHRRGSQGMLPAPPACVHWTGRGRPRGVGWGAGTTESLGGHRGGSLVSWLVLCWGRRGGLSERQRPGGSGRRPQAGGSGGGCGQLASDCPVSPGKTPCRDRTGTSTLALTTRPSPAPSAPQGPRPAPGEPPSGATCHSARPACPCFGRSPRVRGGEPTAPSQRGDVE